MRRLILIATLVLVLASALAACGGSGNDGSGAQTATPAPATTSPAAGNGAAIWESQCAGCHAQDPAGVGVSDAAEVQRVVKDGVEGMPAFAGKLSAADIKAVSEYVAKASQ